MRPKQYVVVFEQAPENWAAYVPDLAGCVAAGETRDESERPMRVAIEPHGEACCEDREGGQQVPEPGTWTTLVEVA